MTEQQASKPTPRAASLCGQAVASPCNNIELRRATRQIGQLFDDVVAVNGLRAAQLGLLYQISEMNGPTMKELAKALVMDLSALGHTLKPLVRDGYVSLEQCGKDGRVKHVFLTDPGKTKYADGMKLWHTAQGRLEAVMGVSEARQLREVLAMIASDQFAKAFRDASP